MLVTFFGHALRRPGSASGTKPHGPWQPREGARSSPDSGTEVVGGENRRAAGRTARGDSGSVAGAERVAGAEAVAGTRATAATELQCTAGVLAYQRRLMEHQRGGFRFIDPDVAGGSGGRAEKSALSIESGRTDRLGHVVSVLWWHWSRRCIR